MADSSAAKGPIATPNLQDLVNRKWVTLADIAKMQRVTYRTVLRWKEEGRLKAVKVGGSWRVYEEELHRFLTEGNFS